jgi:hypothetical protein
VNCQFWKINSAKDSNLTCYSSHSQCHSFTAIIPEQFHCELWWLPSIFCWVYVIKDIADLIINSWCKAISNRTADTRLPFFLTLSLVERRNPSSSELHPWCHKLFKEGILPRAVYFPSTVLRQFPRTNTLRGGTSGKKTKNCKTFINQSNDSIHINVELNKSKPYMSF